MTCQPYCVCTGLWVYSPGFMAITAPANSGIMRSGLNQPRSPPVLLDGSIDSLLASTSNFSPLSSRSMSFFASPSLATRMWRAWYSVFDGRDLRLVFGVQLLLG